MAHRTAGAALAVAVLLSNLTPGLAKDSNLDTIQPGTYNAITRGSAAAQDADPQKNLGVSAYGKGKFGKRSGAGYTSTSTLIFPCASGGHVQHSSTGIAWKSVGQCDQNHITLSRCDRMAAHGTPCKNDDYGNTTTITSGQKVTSGNFTISATCIEEKCTVTVVRKDGIERNSGQMRSQGRAALKKSRQDGGIHATVTATATDPDYLAYRRTSGARLSGCSQRITDEAKATNTVIDCTNTKRSDLTFNGTDCGKRCIGQSTTQEKTVELCESVVPVTKQICSTTYGSHHCFIQPGPGGTLVSSCEATKKPKSGCEDASKSCQVETKLKTKTCHYNRKKDEPKYRCPDGTEFDPFNLKCTTDISCPAQTHYPGYGTECIANNIGSCGTTKCKAPATCPDGYELANGQCSVDASQIGDDALPTIHKPVCPTGYNLTQDGDQCRLQASECGNQGEDAPGKDAVTITSAKLITPDDNTHGLNVHWDADGTRFHIDYSTTQSGDYCDPSTAWRAVVHFDLPHGKTQIAGFFARHLNFDDNMVVTLNGKEIYASNLKCTEGNKNDIDVKENLAPALKRTGNVLELEAYGGPPNLELHAAFVVSRTCTLNPVLKLGNDASNCTLVSKSDESGQIEQFDCGYKKGFQSSCAAGAVAAYKSEGRSHVETDDNDQTIAYDEVYSQETTVKTGDCTVTQSPFCHETTSDCVDDKPRLVDGVKIKRKCFTTARHYQCDNGGNVAQCNDDEIPGDCTFSTTTCLQTGADDQCLVKRTNYVCKNTGTVQTCTQNVDTSLGCGDPIKTCAKKDALGNCLKRETVTRCYSKQPDRCMHDESCKLSDTKCAAKDSDSGLCKLQTQKYDCTRTHTQCTKTAAVCGQKPPGQPFGKGFNKVAAAEGKANALVQEAKRKGSNLDDIRIFEGKAVSCTDDLVGEPIAAKCCSNKADSSGLVDACNQEEKDLAAAKRAKRTHNIGRYCSKKINLGLTSVCVAKRSTYCQFDSLLARLVQEQGRPQLNKIAQAPTGSTSQQALTFPYMGSKSGWSTSIEVRGRKVYGYTWDTACLDTNKQAANQSVDCPVGSEFFVAACEGNKCPASGIPDPYQGGNNQTDWKLVRMDAEKGTRGVTIAKNATAGGRCAKQDGADGGYSGCRVTINSWPRGASGASQFAIDVSWSQFRDDSVKTGWATKVRRSGRFRIQPYQIARTDGVQMPDQIPIRIAVGDGSFKTYSIPTTIPPGGVTLSTTPASRIYGACHPARDWCRMKVLTRVKVDGKHWCSGNNCPHKSSLDCSGFTIDQFMALDFSEMDLSEFTNSVSPKIPQANVVQGIAGSDATKIKNDYQSGADAPSRGSKTDLALKISPTDGRAPWETTAQIAKQMKTGKGLLDVRAVNIAWGDGHYQTVHPGDVAGAYKVTHKYVDKGNRTFSVVMTFHLDNGQTRRARAKLRTWTHDPPKDISPYGGGQSGGTTHRVNETPSGRAGTEAPPGHYDLSGDNK